MHELSNEKTEAREDESSLWKELVARLIRLIPVSHPLPRFGANPPTHRFVIVPLLIRVTPSPVSLVTYPMCLRSGLTMALGLRASHKTKGILQISSILTNTHPSLLQFEWPSATSVLVP